MVEYSWWSIHGGVSWWSVMVEYSWWSIHGGVSWWSVMVEYMYHMYCALVLVFIIQAVPAPPTANTLTRGPQRGFVPQVHRPARAVAVLNGVGRQHARVHRDNSPSFPQHRPARSRLYGVADPGTVFCGELSVRHEQRPA